MPVNPSNGISLIPEELLSHELHWLTPDLALELSRLDILRAVLRRSAIDHATQRVELAEEAKAESVSLFLSKAGLNNEAKVQQYLQTKGWRSADLERIACRPLKIQRLSQQLFQSQIEKYFLDHKDGLDRVVYSLIRTTNGGLAKELYLQIQEDGASFPKLASEYSEGKERLSQGVVGPVPLNKAHPRLVKRLKSAIEGEVLEPFRVEQWWVILRVDRRITAMLDESTSALISEKLMEQWLNDQVEACHRVIQRWWESSGYSSRATQE